MESLIPLNTIALDASLQTRLTIREDYVAAYAALMRDGVVFPAVVLFTDGGRHFIGDGFHRVLAAREAGLSELLADVRGGTRDDALWFALGANRHGYPLTPSDKKHAIQIALLTFPQFSLNVIADQMGCSRRWVQDVARQTAATRLPAGGTVIGRDGHEYPRAPRAARPRTEALRAEVRAMLRAGRTSKEIRHALQAHTQLIADEKRRLGMAVPNRTRAFLRDRLDEMRRLAAEGHSSRQIAEAVGLTFAAARGLMRREGITVRADAVVGHSKRLNANRIVDHIVIDAEHLVADFNLIDFTQLDHARLPLWLRSLAESREKLGAFIRRLMKERGANNGEAA